MQKEQGQKSARYIWWAIAGVSATMLWAAHAIFQNWLYMPPCEQCVYIRFACAVIAVSAFVAGCMPIGSVRRMLAIGCTWLGLGYGLLKSWILIGIYQSVHSDSLQDLFGATLCSLEPHFPFSLPLDRWWPTWFAPTGDCGFDQPVVPEGADLGVWQEWFIALYQNADGWYVWPDARWLNMPECALAVFAVMTVFAGYVGVRELFFRKQ